MIRVVRSRICRILTISRDWGCSHTHPFSPELSLRAKRGNLVGAGESVGADIAATASRLPRRKRLATTTSLLIREQLAKLLRHSRASGNPERLCSNELWIPAFAGIADGLARPRMKDENSTLSTGTPSPAHAYPFSPELSLRAKRGNLVKVSGVARGTRSPRRFAPGDDKLGTREPSPVKGEGVFSW